MTIDVVPADRGRADRSRRGRASWSASSIALVAFAHVSNVLGSILDAKRAAEIAHSKGALLLLDGCQAVPRMPVDVAAIGCDFYAFSGHKLYGPTGIGCLWGRAELLDAMPPWQGGGAMIEQCHVRARRPTPRRRSGSRRGRRTSSARSGSTPRSTGSSSCRSTRSTRTKARWSPNAAAALRRDPRRHPLRPRGQRRDRQLRVDGVHPHDIGTILDDAGVAVRAGHHCAQPLMDGARRPRDRPRQLRRAQRLVATSRRWSAGCTR